MRTAKTLPKTTRTPDAHRVASNPRSTLEQWSVLAAVVDHGGFNQAADALRRSQSSLSYTVARLEEALGIELLVTEGRRAVLTDVGRTLLERSRDLVRDLARLEALAASLQRGWEAELDIAVDLAYPRAALLGILADLQQSCPSTRIQLQDVVLSGAEEAIVQGVADVVITSRVPENYLGDWLMDVTFRAAAAPSHSLFALGRPLVASDLEQHTQAVVRDSGVGRPRDEGWLGSRHRFTVSSMDASLSTLLAGLAYAWLPDHVLQPALDAGRLCSLPLEAGATRVVPLYIVAARGDRLGPAAKAAVAAFEGLRAAGVGST